MPLHADQPLAFRLAQLNGFDDPVGRACYHGQHGCDVLQRLVMPAVGANALALHRAGEERARIDGDVVFALSMVDWARALGREILMQRPAQRDVENLYSATDRQNGEPRRDGRAYQGGLDNVTRVIDAAELWVRAGV